jgi:hypothetical protein
MSYYPTFSVGVVSFVSSPSHTHTLSLSLSLSHLCDSLPQSLSWCTSCLPFLNLFLWKNKWDSLFLPIITPAKQSFFFFLIIFIFGDTENLANCSQNLAEVVEFLHWKIKFSQFLNQKRQKSVRKPKKISASSARRFSGLIF